uniref:Uncharacterized protein n=1 Tax=Marseillevirus LCMAC101 TaxID=2506602 RepID=A0A481YSJ6_9VIRU|nr:MAG: hypothetical protein LCMAC101_03200 [Marseillevirus LCMAC101]
MPKITVIITLIDRDIGDPIDHLELAYEIKIRGIGDFMYYDNADMCLEAFRDFASGMENVHPDTRVTKKHFVFLQEECYKFKIKKKYLIGPLHDAIDEAVELGYFGEEEKNAARRCIKGASRDEVTNK